MLVETVMSRRAMVIEADATVTQAAECMRAWFVGALPVIAHQRLVGMVTDRDLVARVLARNLDAKATRVREVMTRNPVTCLLGESVEQAAALMRKYEIRRLVVVDEALAPVGLLSLDDLALRPETAALLARVLAHAQDEAH